ncbi:SDR family NAD(P)-dependent oxidoreductase [Mycobacterium sp. WMMD1722]|uniref:SDR family NAD(P)-dependent oxidoreductase n=1 Tax=Mycobacterium sp. WMMD1722 TaxID=3404117 RepID=UPI003BF59788
MSTWLITGASRGLGAAIARCALDRGETVVATARRADSVRAALGAHDRLLPLDLDVTDPAAADRAVAAAVERFGGIDVVVNNAGRALVGLFEETPVAQLREQFELNVYGVVNVVRAVLPTLRGQGAGTIVNVSSTAGIVGFAGSSLYNAAKFAVEGLTVGLREELQPLGIRVFAIEPGYFRTDLLDPSTMWVAEHAGTIADYRCTPAHRLLDELASISGAQDGDPAKLAALLHDVVHADELPTRLPIGPDAVELAEQRARRDAAELAPWRDLAVSTNF